MATPVGRQPIVPVLNVTAGFNQKPVKFSAFLDALKVHYKGDIPSYEDLAILVMIQARSYNEENIDRDLHLTPRGQALIETRVIAHLPRNPLEPSNTTQDERRTREDQEFRTTAIAVCGIFLLVLYGKACQAVGSYFFR